MMIAGCQVTAQIYESANSLVYRGYRNPNNQPIILKILKQNYPTPSELTRYKQEYEITSYLNLDGVIKAYDLQKYQNTLVIIVEDFGGESLKRMLGERQLNLTEFLSLASRITEIVGSIHSANVIHKDLNPANIVFNPTLNQIKIIDFGISTILSGENPTLKNPNILEGTLAYMSPEQTGRMNRYLDYRTDFYSLGVTFYELITHQLPFTTNDALELVHCHIAKQPVPPHEIDTKIPKSISDIVIKLMAKTAEERYQSAWGIQADLEECLNQLQTNGEIQEFPLGRQDISDKFQIPQKLYGREREVDIFLTAFEQVMQGQRELMLIAGYSGIGKSALVQEIYKPLTRQKGYFISGKFDQFQRNIPYSAIVSAFSELVRQLLTESKKQLNQWREKLKAALGVNCQVIIDVIPEVELIVGEQPPVAQLSPSETQNRFNQVFQNFIRVFCSQEHPLVIFLDDLQWADSATLKLIDLMMTDSEEQYLFLLGAYRDNEVSLTHPLIACLDKIQNQGANVNKITLVPLELQHVTQLIAETLHRDTQSVQPLATLVLKKTGGNPFFVNQFLKTLYQERLITFEISESGSRGQWQWDIHQIEAIGITDNVVELMVSKFKKLPDSTQQVARLAACVGNRFDLNTLSIIYQKTTAETFKDLMSAIQAELIIPTSELETSNDVNSPLLILHYKFLHDRVQQAAYALISDDDKKAVRLQIGRLLHRNTPPEELSDKIFDIIEHLNLGAELVTSQSEKNEMAQLNLIAAEKAKEAMAYEPAVRYLRIGLELLAETSWQSDYELTLNLSVATVEAEYLNTNLAAAKQLSDQVLQSAQTILDKVKIYELQMRFFVAQNQYVEAIATALEVLALLAVSLPTKQRDMNAAVKTLKSELTQRVTQVSALVDLPEMSDPYYLAAMRILMNAAAPAYAANATLWKLIVFTMVKLSIQYGNSPWSAFGYGFYAAILCGVYLEIDYGYQFGQLSLQVLEKFNATEVKAPVKHFFSVFVRHWKEHSRESLEPLRENVQSGLETGFLEFAFYSAIDYGTYLIFTGVPLESINQQQTHYLELMSKLKMEFHLYFGGIWNQMVLNLLGQSDSTYRLIGKSLDESKTLQFWQEQNIVLLLFCAYCSKTILSYLFKEYAEAVEVAQLGEKVSQGGGGNGFISYRQHNFYYSLALLADIERVDESTKKHYLKKVAENQKKMKIWAAHAPVNCQHKYELVEAEKARFQGKRFRAMELYDRVIKGARENGYIQEEALAYERAAEFYLSLGREDIAQAYMQNAHYTYVLWGATAKVKDLESRYPQLISQRLTKDKKGIKTVTTTTSNDSGSALDLATVIKASQTIGSEIVLEKLLANLMKILIENAGAQFGYLILRSLPKPGTEEGQLLIEASGVVDADKMTVLQSIPIESSLSVSPTIINYVARTQSIVVLNDATREGNFTHDPYIQKHQPKSILCFPLINQGKLVSIIYLENHLTIGAFTPDRLEVLKILSSQAAISIENARLYQTLEDKVEERTAQLAQANQEISALNERLKAENMRMSAELEVTKQLQQMILPKQEELDSIDGLEIAGFMEPADEVGGDYYDVLQKDGKVKIGIGDVTGHGLESGVLMLMTQTAIRTLQESNQTDPVQFLDILNHTIYQNVQRINPAKNLTLALLDYADGILSLSGQHEEVIVVRSGGKIEQIDTVNLGFPIGLDEEIADFISSKKVQLNPGDVVVLYTDGITEAFDINRQQYGLERLCEVVSHNWERKATEIRQAVIEDVRMHIGNQKVYDDITLVIIKQK